MDMNAAIADLLEDIKADYAAWSKPTGDATRDKIRADMVERFNASLSVQPGRKYIKIVKDGSVWGFIVAGDDDKKFRKGDILKAAGWNAPARNHARGNVLDGGYTIQWTGPLYM